MDKPETFRLRLITTATVKLILLFLETERGISSEVETVSQASLSDNQEIYRFRLTMTAMVKLTLPYLDHRTARGIC
ncbi:MAG: hypothetical protein WKG07_40810 [Hymenobacter sp.]